MDNHKKSPQLKVKELCENCGKLVRHKNSDCPKLLEANVDNIPENNIEDGNVTKKKYVPVHLAGTCPYCEYKFSDLLGHIR